MTKSKDNKMATLEEIRDAIRIQNLLPKVAKEIIVSRELEGIPIRENERKEAIERFLKSQGIKKEQLKEFKKISNLDDTSIEKLACRPLQLEYFKEERWGPVATSLYLKNKEKYEYATYYQVSSKDECMMQEVYFRLKDNEQSWKEISEIFHPEGGVKATTKGPQSISKLNKQIAAVVRENNKKEPSQPFRVGSDVVVIQTIRIESPKYDTRLRALVVKEAYDAWLEAECKNFIQNI